MVDGAWALAPASQSLLKLALTDAAGAKTLTVQVPADPTLEGTFLVLQWIQTDGANASISNPSGLAIGG